MICVGSIFHGEMVRSVTCCIIVVVVHMCRRHVAVFCPILTRCVWRRRQSLCCNERHLPIINNSYWFGWKIWLSTTSLLMPDYGILKINPQKRYTHRACVTQCTSSKEGQDVGEKNRNHSVSIFSPFFSIQKANTKFSFLSSFLSQEFLKKPFLYRLLSVPT